MKRIIIVAACLMFVRVANAQKSLLSIDEHNKYIYYKVVDIAGFSADSLFRNGSGFVKIAYPKNKSAQINNGSITVKDKLLTRSVVTFVKHENGEVNYTLNIECKDSKYRYWLTDFVFTPYTRDRYGVFVPINGIAIPLEKAKAKINNKELEGYLDQTGAFCKQLGERLQQYMAENHEKKKTDQQPAKVVTDKW